VRGLLLRWVATAAAVAVASWLVPGISVEGGVPALLAVALILGLINAVVRPVLRGLSCGLIVLTLGLFIFIINALMLLLVEVVADGFGVGFSVDGFGAALLGSVVISVVSFLLSVLVPGGERRKR
jgi:putative membrane protein